jgi:hypothetical protein
VFAQEFAARAKNDCRVLPSYDTSQNDTTHHARKRGDDLIVREIATRVGHEFTHPRDPVFHAFREAPVCRAPDPDDLRSETRYGTPHLRVHDVPGTEIRIDEGLKRIGWPCAGSALRHPGQRLFTRVFERLAHEIVLGCEVRVEAAVREPGVRHDVTDPHVRNAASAKFRGGRVDDFLTRL